ncbi:MAG: sigma-70 family RNA polymerase sigma factor [Actinobacteria bacterium]|nr:sigma-70 family RNA polymerase sigma factor [Actinomycetota bacterium]
MYYKARQKQELSPAEMKRARDGFRGKLFRLRYSPQFIENNCDELLAIAHSEYARAIDEGVEIRDPVAWTIHCAWRRTQNLLQAENHRPRNVSTEAVEPIVADELAPEELVEIEDRARKVREAVAKLSMDQKKVIALTFFEDFSVREAAKRLNWKPARVQHHRDMALRELRRFFPVTDSDELWVDVGLAAWLAVAGGGLLHFPGGFEAVLDKAADGGASLWAKAHDLARRFTIGGGNDAASAVASSGVARTAGACATGAAIVCIAGASTGIVGPGLPGLADGGGNGAIHRKATRPAARQPKRTAPPAAEAASAVAAETNASVPASAPPPSTRREPPKKANDESRSSSRTTAAKRQRAEEEQVEAETSAFAKAASESAPAPAPESAAVSEVASAEAPTVVHTTSEAPKASASESKSAASEFSFEK